GGRFAPPTVMGPPSRFRGEGARIGRRRISASEPSGAVTPKDGVQRRQGNGWWPKGDRIAAWDYDEYWII
ncbi:hypothetical protein, partial [Parasulfuritortus cantonensis]|uniref:hypothetical protein n=1 Tax=Parasulfuritortus cantonensis TaxID=2528202 RepID=UPI0019819204